MHIQVSAVQEQGNPSFVFTIMLLNGAGVDPVDFMTLIIVILQRECGRGVFHSYTNYSAG